MPNPVPRRTMLLLALLPAARVATAETEGASVTIDNFTFTPAELTVQPGTRVTWTNRDDIPHTVVNAASPPAFRSHPLDTGDTFEQLFDRPGRFSYFCSLHPHMHGTVVVR
jgi:plastocyanin